MRKYMAAFLLAVLSLFVVSAAFPLLPEAAQADDDARVFDDAGLFFYGEQDELEEQAAAVRKQTGMDMVIVTTDDAGGLSAESYADHYYDDGGFGTGTARSGALFLIDMDNRELYLSTSGNMIRYLTDSAVEDILDDAYDYVSDEDYAGAAAVVMEDVEYYYSQGIREGQYNYDRETGRISRHRSIRWYEILLSLAVAGFAAGTAVAGVKRQYSMKKEYQTSDRLNMAYRANAQFACGARNDVLVNSYVHRQIIPRVTGRGPRGPMGGGSSGGGGRSTTHRSGGHTHGGGGRRF